MDARFSLGSKVTVTGVFVDGEPTAWTSSDDGGVVVIGGFGRQVTIQYEQTVGAESVLIKAKAAPRVRDWEKRQRKAGKHQ